MEIEENDSPVTNRIVLAGGCFWGMEKLYRSFNGIVYVTAGYANGRGEEYANYESVCSGRTGFREAVLLEYEPAVISLKTILDIFFSVIDPTMFNRQGMDMGSQYQTGIYWENGQDSEFIRERAAEEAAKYREFWTEIKPLENFYPAEEYHQIYLEKHPDGYCHISPSKIERLVQTFQEAQTLH